MPFVRRISVLALYAASLSVAHAADGDFSLDFGAGTGYVVRDLALGGGSTFNVDLDELSALALRADERWIAAGDSCCANVHSNYLVSRWTSAGAPDSTFGASGTGYTWGNIASTEQSIAGVVAAPAGHIFAAQNFASDAAVQGGLLLEFNADGSVAGISNTDANYTYSALVSGLHNVPSRITSEGMYFAVGWKTGTGNAQIAHLRGYTDARGTPSGFGGATGVVDVNLSTGYTLGSSSRTDNRFYAAAMQPDGKIVACGYVPYNGSDVDMAVARFNRDGSLDSSFNGTGIQFVNFDIGGVDEDECDAIAVQRDGKIVLGGTVTDTTGHAAALARLTSTGQFDTTFGAAHDGHFSFAYKGVGSSDDIVRGIAIQPNGAIVVAGFIYSVGNPKFATARVLPNGTLDASYRGAGGGTYDFTNVATSQANAVVIDHHGQISIAGTAKQTGQNTTDQLLVKLRNADSIYFDGYEDF